MARGEMRRDEINDIRSVGPLSPKISWFITGLSQLPVHISALFWKISPSKAIRMKLTENHGL